jgi:hypothetical protein
MIRFIAAICLLLLLPGFAVRRLLAMRHVCRSLWLPGSVSLSLAVLAPVLVFWPGPLRAAVAVACLAAATLAAIAFLRPSVRGRDGAPVSLTVIVAALGAASVALWLGAAQDGDSYLHLAIVQKLLRQGTVSHEDAFYAQSGIDARYGFTLWHPLVASLSTLSFLTPTRIWTLLPALVAPMYVLIVACLTTSVTQSRIAGSFAALAVLLYHVGAQDGRLIPLAANPSHVACLVLVPTALILALNHIRHGKRWIVGVGLTTWAIVSVHPFHGVLELLVLTGLAVPFLLRGAPDERRRAAACVLTVGLVLLPPALLRLMFQLRNPFWLDRGSTWELTGALWAPSPRVFLPGRPGYLWLVYGLTAVHLFHPASSRALRGVAIAAILPLACALNPFIAPWLGARLSPQMLARFDHVTFYVLGFVLVGASVARLYGAVGGCRGGALRGAVVVLLAVSFCQSWPGLRNTWAAKRNRERVRGFSVLRSELQPFHRVLESWEVVASDEATSFLLPTFLPVRVVAIPRGSASPADSGQRHREQAMQEVLDPSTEPSVRAALLRTYGATAVILDTTRTPRVARSLMGDAPGMVTVARSGRFVLLRPAPPSADPTPRSEDEPRTPGHDLTRHSDVGTQPP